MCGGQSKSDRRSVTLVGIAYTSRVCRMVQASAEKLKQAGSAEGWTQRHKVSGWQDARAAFAKRKSNRAISSDHQIVRWESQGER